MTTTPPMTMADLIGPTAQTPPPPPAPTEVIVNVPEPPTAPLPPPSRPPAPATSNTLAGHEEAVRRAAAWHQARKNELYYRSGEAKYPPKEVERLLAEAEAGLAPVLEAAAAYARTVEQEVDDDEEALAAALPVDAPPTRYASSLEEMSQYAAVFRDDFGPGATIESLAARGRAIAMTGSPAACAAFAAGVTRTLLQRRQEGLDGANAGPEQVADRRRLMRVLELLNDRSGHSKRVAEQREALAKERAAVKAFGERLFKTAHTARGGDAGVEARLRASGQYNRL